MVKKVSKFFVKAMEKQYPKGAIITPKKPVKKANGGEIVRNPPALGIPGKDKMARGPKRPGGDMVTRPGFPEGKPKPILPTRPGAPSGNIGRPIPPTTRPSPGAIMPMRRAKGGMAKGKKK